MRALLRYTVLLLACLGLALQAGAARAEYLVMEVGLQFPDRLGSVPLWKGERYPRAGLGHGIEYRAPGFAGSVYVYDAGNPNIPNGTDNETVRTQFSRARNEIVAYQRHIKQPEPQPLSEQPIRASSVEFLAASYRVVRGDVETVSLVAMTGYRRHFIKIRVSVPAASGAAGARQMEEFVQNVARMLADAGAR
ncbi:MAG: hypothetical protein KF889_16005 [Alphaproteobacteria bacterium]|nr:hypothetical protein [Alphaproteobacteria bacterium]MCW5740129.1 hypothetical protein [Alphaproteobacteria bacterium]